MAVTYQAAIEAHRARPKLQIGEVLELAIPAGKIAYNPAFIEQDGRHILAVRVESKDSHWLYADRWDPEIWFFELLDKVWVRLEALTITAAEDPFVAWIGPEGKKELIFGHVTLDRSGEPLPIVVTQFYRVADFTQLVTTQPFAEVRDMKDIRLCELDDGRIMVCGRPKGAAAGRGKVSVTILDDLDGLHHDAVWNATILADMVTDDVRIGNNELHPLKDGRVGVLGHIAMGIDEEELHYAAASWIIEPATLTATAPQIIAERADFPYYEPKFAFLSDVIFPGSITKQADGRCRLYCGLSDSAVACIDIADPFA